MKSVTGRELAKALEKKGWSLLRIQGSHHIKPLKRGLLRFFLKAASLSDEDV